MNNSELLAELIEDFQLNLAGLNIYTEAASGHYIFGPILAALAGASHVTAQVGDSAYGKAKDIIEETERLAFDFGVSDSVLFVSSRSHQQLARSDIVTNSGHVRPFDADLLNLLKRTAVVPLMWETWELRKDEFDLKLCKDLGILVLGTNEQMPPCNMNKFIILSGIKLLFELGYEGGDVLLLGNAPIPGMRIANALRGIGAQVTWVSDDPLADYSYRELSGHFADSGSKYSHLFVAEHKNPALLLGADGLLDFDSIIAVNRSLKIAVMCGNVDSKGLRKSGLDFAPEVIAPFGFMGYQPAALGPRPVMTLYAAGLKVGERMARARLAGQPPAGAAAKALVESPAMDFMGSDKWITP